MCICLQGKLWIFSQWNCLGSKIAFHYYSNLIGDRRVKEEDNWSVKCDSRSQSTIPSTLNLSSISMNYKWSEHAVHFVQLFNSIHTIAGVKLASGLNKVSLCQLSSNKRGYQSTFEYYGTKQFNQLRDYIKYTEDGSCLYKGSILWSSNCLYFIIPLILLIQFSLLMCLAMCLFCVVCIR